MSRGRALHPEQLPWFANGQLDHAQAAEIEKHVQGCESCRAEVSALRSMYRSLRGEAASDHVSAARLVAYHDVDARISDDERRLVAEHLQECLTCSVDLAALQRADASKRAGHGRRWLGAAASVLVVVTLGWQTLVRRAESPASPAVTRVVFSPAQRGSSPVPRLTGPGPWEIEVWLPLHATAKQYHADIHRGDERFRPIVDRIVATGSKDGSVGFNVPGGLVPGHYVLTLIPLDDEGSESVVYGFDAEGPP